MTSKKQQNKSGKLQEKSWSGVAKIINTNQIKPLFYTVLGAVIVLAIIGAKCLVSGNILTAIKKETVKMELNTPTPLETISALNTTEIPLAQPTTNPYFAIRIEEIDTRINELEAQKAKAKEARDSTIASLTSGERPIGYNPMNTILLIKEVEDTYKERINTIQAEITELNAEKSQIMTNV